MSYHKIKKKTDIGKYAICLFQHNYELYPMKVWFLSFHQARYEKKNTSGDNKSHAQS